MYIKAVIKLILVVTVLTVGCGSPESPQEQPSANTPVTEEVVPQPVCFQQSSSPAFPELVDDIDLQGEPEPLNNREIKIVAETFDCLLSRELITEEEHECLMGEIPDQKIVYGVGRLQNNGFKCGSSTAFGGCIRQNVAVINLPHSSDDTIRHELGCHFAKHYTTGERNHEDPDWWHEGINDCVCERVIR